MIYQVLLRKMEGIEWEMLSTACLHKPFWEKHWLYNTVQGMTENEIYCAKGKYFKLLKWCLKKTSKHRWYSY